MNSAVRVLRRLRSSGWGILVVGAAYWGAWWLRFEFSIPHQELPVAYEGLLIALLIKGITFAVLRLELDCWSRYLCFSDVISLLKANLAASAAAGVGWWVLIGSAFPRSLYLLDLLLCVLASGGVRFSARLYDEVRAGWTRRRGAQGLLIYGAGVAGIALAREIRNNPSLGYQVIGFLDDDPRKHGARFLGLPVLGGGEHAKEIVQAYRNRVPPVDEIAVAMPSATGDQIRAAVRRGRAAGVRCRVVPALGELISGKLPVNNLHEISVTDLLEREPIELDRESVRRALSGCVVLVTGAAGSIGSELCHQVAQLKPRRLIALDQAETETCRLESELRSRYSDLCLSIEIADIRDARRMEQIIEEHGVEVVFHAAAYKHVPIMERQVIEAVRNNVIGTWNLVQAAWRANVARFVMISTDKAVNPSSIMGLTKRVAELIVAAKRPPVGRGSATKCVCVRFGNVLVSNGSVVPIFQKQIASGGPVTVTHPEMQRYFMTVQEAVQLVLQASTMGEESEVFVLDMGKPVRIVELARKMITLAGLVPDEDIKIEFIGPRPGEKLLEEVSLHAESLRPTSHPKIRVFQGRQLMFSEVVPWIAELRHLLWRSDPAAVIEHLRSLVPEYRPATQTLPLRSPQPVELESPALLSPVEAVRALRTAAG